MEAKQENSNVMSCTDKELSNGTENPVLIDTVVLESDISESGSNVGEGGGGNCASCSSCAFRPPPPFLLKIYDMVENSQINSIISWNSTGTSFIIWNAHLFAANILPQYFRHNNFQSFVCQLNTYGFKKINWDQWEFKNERFQKGKIHLLKYIKRRNQYPQSMKKPVRTEQKVDTSSLDTEKELQILMNDQNELKVEIMKLKEQQDAVEKEIASIKNEALSNALKNQKKVLFMVQTFLPQLRELSSDGVENPTLLIEKRSTDTLAEPVDGKVTPLARTYGKNVIEETPDTKRTPGQDSAGILKLNSEHFAPREKLIMDDLASIRAAEEQTTEFQSNTLIPLEDLIGRSCDWVEYLRELDESNSSQI
ncbi:heat shock factor protein HSF30-like [Olea europaea var. sylvestris]|uniref:heat shock factor protein HSF30-like n=1 Tax=Olea europaea var. sylvestris TaxID=158386 RepID=UPI000C1D12BC|nr:heat shock factor protein HSF30-like [Olea europaea var. sylvestris]